MAIQRTVIVEPSNTMLIGWIVGASRKAGKAGSVQAITVSLGVDSTGDRVRLTIFSQSTPSALLQEDPLDIEARAVV